VTERAALRAESFSVIARVEPLARKTNSGWYYAIHNLKQHQFLIDVWTT
jgi:hypothetical protein